MTTVTQRPIYRFADLVLDLGNETLRTKKGALVTLRPKSFALLQLLVENAGRLVTRDMIMEVLWPDVFVTDDSITQCVLDVRRALGDISECLKTVRRRGYIFERGILPPEASDAAAWQHDAGCFDEGISARTGTVTGGCYTGNRATLAPTVLLLPLKTLDESETRIGESLTEEILGELTQQAKLLVGPEMRIEFHDDRLGRRPADMEDRGAVYILRGSVRGKPAIELNLQLFERGSGTCIWSNRSDLAGLTGRRARLVQELPAALFKDVEHRIGALAARELKPDDLLFQAHALLLRPRSIGVLHQALRRFEEAFALDPESNGARLGIANVLVNNLANGWSRSIEEDEARADALLRDALEVNANVGLVHAIKGTLRRLQGLLKESRIEFEIAMELAPDYAMAASQFGWTLFYSGEPDEALRWLERGVERGGYDAQMPLLVSNLGTGRLLVGDLDGAIELLLTAAARIPAHSAPLIAIAAAFGLKSDAATAGAALQRGIAASSALRSLSAWRHWIARQGSEILPIYQQTIERGLRWAGMPEE